MSDRTFHNFREILNTAIEKFKAANLDTVGLDGTITSALLTAVAEIEVKLFRRNLDRLLYAAEAARLYERLLEIVEVWRKEPPMKHKDDLP